MAKLCDLAQVASDGSADAEQNTSPVIDASQIEASIDMFLSHGEGSPTSFGSASLSGYLARTMPAARAGLPLHAPGAARNGAGMNAYRDAPPPWAGAAARKGRPPRASAARQDIVALAPEWASLAGGTLVLIVGPWEAEARDYSIRIGTQVVPAQQLQAGVLACHTPSMPRSYNTSLEVWKAGVPVSLPVPFAFCRLNSHYEDGETRGSPLPSHEGSPRLARAFSPGPPPSMTVEVEGDVSSSLGKMVCWLWLGGGAPFDWLAFFSGSS